MLLTDRIVLLFSRGRRSPAVVQPVVVENAISGEIVEEDVELGAVEASGSLKSQHSEEESQYPTGIKLVLILTSLLITEFLSGLDQTIVAAASASVANEFQALTSVGWYGSSYLLTGCALQPLAGRAYNYFPQKWVFLAAVVIFGVASIICATAKADTVFIFGRALQGVGFSGIYIGLFLIGSTCLPPHLQAIFTGMISASWGVGASLGPLIGGSLASRVSWRWCFWVNLPPVIVMIVVLVFYVHPPKIKQTLPVKQRLLQMDWIGAMLLLAGMACILTALQEGGISSPWKSGRIIGLLVASGVSTMAFIILQSYLKERASISIRVSKQRNMALLAICNATVGAGYFSVLYAEPTYFQAVRGSSALTSGVQTLATIIPCVIMGIVAGWSVSRRRRFRYELLVGTGLTSIGAGLLSLFKANSSAGTWIGYQIVVGTGIGTGYMLCYVATQAIIPAADRRAAATIVIFAQLLGATLWISVCESIYQNRLLEGILRIPGLDPNLVINSGVSEFRKVVPTEFLPAVVGEAVKALFCVFIGISALTGLGFLCVFGLDSDHIKEE